MYRVTNPRQLMVFWLMIFGGGWVALKHLPHIANLGNASAWDIVGALAGLVWIICVPIAVWFFVRHYRRGFEVAITSDGLIVRLPGFSGELIPWRDIGGVANVFPTRVDVERFVEEVNDRVDATTGAEMPSSPPWVGSDDASHPGK